jgi:hypothetical protein
MNNNVPQGLPSTTATFQSAWMGAIVTIIAGAAVAFGVSFVSGGPTIPVLIWCGSVLVAAIWIIDSLRGDRAHARSIEAGDAETRNEVARKYADAQIAIAEASSGRQLVVSPVAPAPLRDDQLRTPNIPNPGGNGYFTIPLSLMKGLIEAYPATNRAMLIPNVVNGGAEHSQLIAAGEYYGWLTKPRDAVNRGQGVAAKWAIPVERAMEMLAGMYVEAEQRARGQLPQARTSDGLIKPTTLPARMEVIQHE